jgi:hypothetical protein
MVEILEDQVRSLSMFSNVEKRSLQTMAVPGIYSLDLSLFEVGAVPLFSMSGNPTNLG